jgi:hypothetical protein
MYSVYQHWDPLKVCVIGRSYPPEFYDYIKNRKVRKVFYRIAEETEEDYQLLINKLQSFGVEIMRPEIKKDFGSYLNMGKFDPPPMTPRDYTAMIGNTWYSHNKISVVERWNLLKGADWPECPCNYHEWSMLPESVLYELRHDFDITSYSNFTCLPDLDIINQFVSKADNNVVYNQNINSAMTTRVGKDLYFGTHTSLDNVNYLKKKYSLLFPNYRCHIVDTQGHSDGTFCPVVPGLIISLADMPTYVKTFPGWEVISLVNQSWNKVKPFLQLKEKNKGKWWVPGEELNDDFTNFVETWMNHWVGYVEETVFDVNMLVIDEKNVVCNSYNKQVFDAFDRYGITGHIINFRHRYFWDGGLHCITSDIHREGIQKDYFPMRG